LSAAQDFRLEIIRLNTHSKAVGQSYVHAATHQKSEIGAGDAGRWRGDVNSELSLWGSKLIVRQVMKSVTQSDIK